MSKKVKPSLVIFVILTAFALRFFGAYPGHNPYHPDEGKAGYISAREMYLSGNLKPLDFNYPTLIPLTEYFAFRTILYPAIWIKNYISDPQSFIKNAQRSDNFLKEIIKNENDTHLLYLGRYLAVFVGTCVVLLVYFVTKDLFSRKAGVFASLIMAINFRAVMNSQFDLPDTYNSFYLLLAFWGITQLIKKPVSKWYLISGILMGLSFSAKLQFFSFVSFIILHLYLIKHLHFRKIFISGFALILTVLVINYYEFLEYDKVYSLMAYQASKYGAGVMKFNLYGLSYLFNIVLTPTVSIASILGIFIGIKKRPLSTLLLTSVIFSFLIYFLYLTSGAYYARNFVTIIPFFAIPAGVFLCNFENILSNRLKIKLLKHAFMLSIIGITCYQSIHNSLIHDYFYMKPWSLTEARNMLRLHVDNNTSVAAHPWDKYVLFSLSNIDVDKKLNFVPLDSTHTYSVEELRETKVNYALIGIDVLSDATSVWWMKNKEINFWNRPVEISKNTFAAVAVRELTENTLFHSIKPWQAPDNNYVFVYIPPKIEFASNKAYSFEFLNSIENWPKIDGSFGKGQNLVFDSTVGHNKNGSLKIVQGATDFPVVRWISPCFKIEKGKGYKIEAWVKSSREFKSTEKDGFLRLDFYDKCPLDWNEKTGSLHVALSQRFYGKDWKKLEISNISPADSNFATVSFQVMTPAPSSFWLDDVQISESQNTLSKESKGYEFSIPDEILVPYSGGGH